MWEKLYQTAERQIAGRKLGKAENTALRALQCAESSGDMGSVLKTQELLIRLYGLTLNPRCAEIVDQSSSCNLLDHLCSSPSSTDVDTLLSFGRWYSRKSNYEKLEKVLKALSSVWETEGYLDEYFVAQEELAAVYVDQKDFVRAEATILPVVRHQNASAGPTSDEMQSLAELYSHILLGLGKSEESEALLSYLYQINYQSSAIDALNAPLNEDPIRAKEVVQQFLSDDDASDEDTDIEEESEHITGSSDSIYLYFNALNYILETIMATPVPEDLDTAEGRSSWFAHSVDQFKTEAEQRNAGLGVEDPFRDMKLLANQAVIMAAIGTLETIPAPASVPDAPLEVTPLMIDGETSRIMDCAPQPESKDIIITNPMMSESLRTTLK